GVGPGEVDELENAQRRRGGSEPAGAKAPLVDDDQLAGLDLPDERRSDDVEGTGLRSEGVALLQAPQHERPQPMGVPCPEEVAGSLVGGLGVLPEAGPGGRVADMPDGDVTGQRGELLLVEDLGNKAHVLVDDNRGAL